MRKKKRGYDKKKTLYVYIHHLNGSIIAIRKSNYDLAYALAAARVAVTD